MQPKPDIKIIPIFNQISDPTIWADFARIETSCRTKICGYQHDTEYESSIFGIHKKEWQHYNYNFAFGAFHDGKMVGFSNGFLSGKTDVFLRNLYVLPEYNGMGIGKRLLRCGEQTAYLFADVLDVRSLSGAVSFYEQNGFVNYDGRSLSKELKKSTIGVIPVFEWKKFLHAKIKFGVDKELLRQNKYQPKFIYVNPDSEIEAVGLQTQDKENVFWVNQNKPCMADFYKKQILRELSKTK